jgi:hypothetical protein
MFTKARFMNNKRFRHDYIEAIEQMKDRGGGFVRALAVAAERADSENFERLLEAFPEIFEKYAENKSAR